MKKSNRIRFVFALAALFVTPALVRAQAAVDPCAGKTETPKPAAKPAKTKAGTGKTVIKPASATTSAPAPARPKYLAGEDPEFAKKMGWPPAMAAPLPGSIFPARRIVAYYGNPLSKKMGVLGEYPVDEMLARLDREVARWNKADPQHPVLPALHLIAVVAQGDPGPSGKYRTRMRDSLVEQVSNWAQRRNAIVFLDVQVGTGSIQEELPRLLTFLERPNIHLGVDPEFMMKDGSKPGTKIGTMSASDINFVIRNVADLVSRKKLAPKILVIHRFTRNMVPDAEKIQLDPRVQVVMNMDGWGQPWLKRNSYRDYIVRHPVQFTGFKLFYHNDSKKGTPIMDPEDVLRLNPAPLYIQYQ